MTPRTIQKLVLITLLTLSSSVFSEYNWTGPYIGVTAGINRIETKDTIPNYIAGGLTMSDITSTNFAGGFKAGYNHQFNSKLLLGIEGNIIFTPGSKSDSLTGGSNSERYSVKQDRVFNVVAKAGYTFDKLLPYVKAGYSNTHLSDLNYFSSDPSYTGNNEAKKSNHSGYILGAGLDYAFKENIILGFDYSYTNYKDKSFVYGGPNTLEPETKSLLGSLSYKF
jgi:outer membrane immunogenic protein